MQEILQRNARFHTKVRNRLCQERSHNSIVVLHDMNRRYSIEKGSGKKTRNRAVVAEEYRRLRSTNDDCGSAEMDGDDGDSDCSFSDSDDGDVDGTVASELNHYLQVLGSLDDGEQWESEVVAQDETNNSDGGNDGKEDTCELSRDLVELPDKNVENYPQENRAYFRTKKYVRNDKYLLQKMFHNSLELPTVMSAFES
mmetsp:Transcript_3287/g.5017  ORF Transcript_3287/g.5017 Transcript_3287/m.5017 type:complete len:198 (+) Transcript_3287:167-760(+)